MHKFKTFLNGGIDELKIYDIALSALEIAYKHDVTSFESTNLNFLNEKEYELNIKQGKKDNFFVQKFKFFWYNFI